MPIINLANSLESIPEQHRATARALEPDSSGRVLYTYLSHVGLCISDRERNGHDDSDFFMTVWDPECRIAHEIEFASTRYWSYPCYGSKPDATPEVLAAYAEWQRKQERSGRLSRIIQWRIQRREIAARCGLAVLEVQELRNALENSPTRRFSPRRQFPWPPPGRFARRYADGHAESLLQALYGARNSFDAVVHLLSGDAAGRLRSPFRQKLAAQVRAWLAEPRPHRYASPLSPRQLECL